MRTNNIREKPRDGTQARPSYSVSRNSSAQALILRNSSAQALILKLWNTYFRSWCHREESSHMTWTNNSRASLYFIAMKLSYDCAENSYNVSKHLPEESKYTKHAENVWTPRLYYVNSGTFFYRLSSFKQDNNLVVKQIVWISMHQWFSKQN